MVLRDIPTEPLDDIKPDQLDGADQLGYQLVRFLRLVSRIGAHVAARQQDGVERAAYAVLAQLVLGGPRRTTALADALHADPSTVSRQTAALVREGLVERRPDPDDGRACRLAATDRGERVFEHNRHRRDVHIAQILRGWTPAEVTALTGLLDRFNTAAEAYRHELLGGRQTAHTEGENIR